MPKTVLLPLGVCLAVAMAVEAPVHATAPSTAAERIVNARIHRKPVAAKRSQHAPVRNAKKHSAR
jgi:hypothetical protein